MVRFFLILLLIVEQIVFSAVAQLPAEEIGRIKSQFHETLADSAKYRIYFSLSQGYRFSNVDSALFYTDKAIALSRDMKDASFEAQALSQKGFILLETGDIPQSLNCQLEALRLSDLTRDPETFAFANNRIGNVYMELGDYEKSIYYYRRAIEIFTTIHQNGYVHNEYSNIGNVYEMMGELDSSKIYQQKVYDFSLTNTDRYAITYAEMRQRFGKVELALGNNDAALQHFRAGINEALRDADFNNLSFIYAQMAGLFYKLQQYDSSMLYARKTIQTANSISLKKAINEASLLLVSLYSRKNQPDSALVYAQLSASVKDSLYGKQRIQDLQRILLSDQQRQQQLEDEKIQLKEWYRVAALLSALIISLIIGTILFRNNKAKQRTNQVLEKTLTNLKATQSQLIHSEKMASLGELTAGIAHEIQNPLNFVNNFSEVSGDMIDEAVGSRQQAGENSPVVTELLTDIKQNLEKINHHGKRADAIVKGMLQHSRSAKGIKEPTDINALADEYLRLAYHGFKAKHSSFEAELKTDFDDSIGTVNVIPQDIGRVLLNLYNNAFWVVREKYKEGEKQKQIRRDVMRDVPTMHDVHEYQPQVSVSTKKKGNLVEISVKDNGNGIPQNIIAKIFQPFFTTKPTGQGTGLGLSLAYDIVKAHGGEIEVNSIEGKGSEFIITLNAGL